MASSEDEGRRPRISRIRVYSSCFKPSSAHGWLWSGVADAFSTVSATEVTLPASRDPPAPRPAIPGRGRRRPTETVESVHAEPGHADRRRAGDGEPDADAAVVEQGAEDAGGQDRRQHGT